MKNKESIYEILANHGHQEVLDYAREIKEKRAIVEGEDGSKGNTLMIKSGAFNKFIKQIVQIAKKKDLTTTDNISEAIASAIESSFSVKGELPGPFDMIMSKLRNTVATPDKEEKPEVE